MPLHGLSFIGNETIKGSNGTIHGVNPATGDTLQPAYGGNTPADLERACTLAARAFDPYRSLPLEKRAAFLEKIAENINALGDELIERAMAESGLPRGRLEGERGRTMGQLKLFAGVIRDGGFLNVRIDPAMPERTPLPRPDLRMRNIPVGPVAVFGASNFPLAFSVAGGDTASALAAGCPVIVKAHPAHPGTSELVAQAIHKAVKESGMPEGTFSMIFDSSYELGAALVADARIYAVGFTGSRRGGLALMDIAARRKRPIPVYAEMSSINPVVLLPDALKQNAAAIGKAFVGALALGSGQFCTNPGLILAIDGPDLTTFIDSTAATMAETAATTMLTPGIHSAYCKGVEQLSQQAGVQQIARGKTAALNQAQAGLFEVSAQQFLSNPVLQEEIFGSTSLVVRCPDLDTLAKVLESLEGQLTGALHMTAADHDAAAKMLPVLERQVGRILVNGFGTGVEVANAMVHGGPFPSTSDGRSSSVGTLAIDRFLRPVCYQDIPAALLAPELQGNSVAAQPRRVDGKLMAAQS